MLAYTGRANHDAYFSDALGEPYTVVVEERAVGIPLVGSAMDGIKRHPIGAPQNLFAVHPVVAHERGGRFGIVRDIIEIAEAFHGAGALILDMRPQNIYFAPDDAAITVIDIGGVTEPRAAGGRGAPLTCTTSTLSCSSGTSHTRRRQRTPTDTAGRWAWRQSLCSTRISTR